MNGVQRVGQLRRDVEQPIAGQRTARDDLVERPAFEQFADQERLAGFLTRLVDRADVRMADQRREARLAAKELHGARPGDFLGPEQLDGDLAIEPQVARPENLAGAVAADRLQELVVRNPHVLFGGVHTVRRLTGFHESPTPVHGFNVPYSARAARRGAKSASAFCQILNRSS